jgi:hypothetical protein
MQFRSALFSLLISTPFCVSAFAQTVKTLEQLQFEDRITKANDVLNAFDKKVDVAMEDRENDCVKAFGSMSFCDCVNKDMPWVFSFNDYISITTKSKEENGYSFMKADMKSAYDKVPAIRNQCVAKVATKK